MAFNPDMWFTILTNSRVATGRQNNSSNFPGFLRKRWSFSQSHGFYKRKLFPCYSRDHNQEKLSTWLAEHACRGISFFMDVWPKKLTVCKDGSSVSWILHRNHGAARVRYLYLERILMILPIVTWESQLKKPTPYHSETLNPNLHIGDLPYQVTWYKSHGTSHLLSFCIVIWKWWVVRKCDKHR